MAVESSVYVYLLSLTQEMNLFDLIELPPKLVVAKIDSVGSCVYTCKQSKQSNLCHFEIRMKGKYGKIPHLTRATCNLDLNCSNVEMTI